MKEKRFYIDCYGICDTWKADKDSKYCKDKRLTWQELCDTLNDLYENVDTDTQRLLLRIRELETENKDLRADMNRIKDKLDGIVSNWE